MATNFPLSWPVGWERARLQVASRFDTATSKAYNLLIAEIGRLGGSAVVVSTNLPLKPDGTPRMDREPVDPGVAVYFTRNGKQVVFACDKFDVIRDNLLAIAKTIEAMRGIERWGASEMMERAFSGFKTLPETAGTGEDCWIVLNIPPMSPAHLVTLAHRDLVRKLHAKGAGSAEFARVNVARDDAMRALIASTKGEHT
jgi:hypothetical protein